MTTKLKIGTPRRAMTLVEMMISVAILSLVSIGVASSLLLAAKHSYKELDYTQAERHARLVSDIIRKRLMIAAVNTVVPDGTIPGETAVLNFEDPVAGCQSQFFFNFETKTLTFIPDVTKDENQRSWQRIDSITFVENPDTKLGLNTEGIAGLIEVEVRVNSRIAGNRPAVLKTLIQVRNQKT